MTLHTPLLAGAAGVLLATAVATAAPVAARPAPTTFLGPLHPLGLALAPNGHLVTANAGNGNLVETTPAARQVAVRTVDRSGSPRGAGALFGLAIPSSRSAYLVDAMRPTPCSGCTEPPPPGDSPSGAAGATTGAAWSPELAGPAPASRT